MSILYRFTLRIIFTKKIDILLQEILFSVPYKRKHLVYSKDRNHERIMHIFNLIAVKKKNKIFNNIKHKQD